MKDRDRSLLLVVSTLFAGTVSLTPVNKFMVKGDFHGK